MFLKIARSFYNCDENVFQQMWKDTLYVKGSNSMVIRTTVQTNNTRNSRSNKVSILRNCKLKKAAQGRRYEKTSDTQNTSVSEPMIVWNCQLKMVTGCSWTEASKTVCSANQYWTADRFALKLNRLWFSMCCRLWMLSVL